MYKKISWRNKKFDSKPVLEDATHVVTNIHVDFNDMITVVMEKGIEVNRIQLSMEHAEQIGFINLSALSSYCK
jgi:hypothetical protein